ncbi:MAG: PAS domain-containing protein [Pirellulales bacterium]
MAGTNVTRVLDVERDFPLESLFFSTTDAHGIILHGNHLFTEISEYTEQELIGAPHSIIRHPDMPRAVFQLLWDTIRARKTIAAYVKNLSKSGRYYWVLALAMPCRDGYLSIRLKPTTQLLQAVQTIYARLLFVERTIEVEPKQRKAAIAASTEELGKLLDKHGFRSYEDFMLHALSAEMASRYSKMKKRDSLRNWRGDPSNKYAMVLDDCEALDQKLMNAYSRIEEFKSTNLALMDRSISILSMAESIRTLSLNATIAASKLGSKGATLQVVSESLGSVSDDSQEATKQLASRMKALVTTLDRLIFDLAATKLQSEISLQFVEEILTLPEHKHDYRLERSLTTLFEEMTGRMDAVFTHLSEAEEGMYDLQDRVNRLARNNKTLRFVQFAGEKEAVAWPDTESFAEVFKQVRSQIDRTKSECDFLAQSLNNSFKEAKALSESRRNFLPHLTSLQQFVAQSVC